MDKKLIILYSRVSSDDGFQANDESNSIANQKKLLTDYVKRNNELCGYNIEHIWDDGYSGTNFERPGVTKLLEMVKRNEVYSIIVKDFSRFGRNYIEVETYLEEIFPILGIRFISVNDNFDSKYKRAIGSIEIGFKNLIHSHYPQETSRKVSQAKLLQFKCGNFTNSFAFFGYLKSEDDCHKIVIDSPAAAIVKYIFAMRLKRMTITQIAKKLNEEKVMTPAERKRQLGCDLYVGNGQNYWTGVNVAKILYDERYTGKMVYLKSKRKSDITFERKRVPRDEWLVRDGDFEAIISRSDFEEVFSMRKKSYTRSETLKTKLFNKIVKCGYCGKTLTMRGHSPYNYYCPKRRFIPEAECRNISIPEESIKNIVLKTMQLQADILLEYKEREKTQCSIEMQKLKQQIDTLKRIVEKRDSDVFIYYEQYKNGSISRSEFITSKENTDSKVEKAQREILALEDELNKTESMEYILTHDEFTRFEESRNIKSLSRELVEALISRIDVYDSERIEITWKYQNFTGGKIVNE